MHSQTTKIIEAAKGLLKVCGYFVDHLWHTDDIHFICEQLQLPTLSNDEAREVFAIANAQFDGETGISWPQLEKALRIFLQRRTVRGGVFEKCPAA